MNLQDVRKILVLSLPPSSETLSMIIDCTLDVNESVRKAAYCVLASKFPLQSLRLAEHIAFTLCFRFCNCCAAVMHVAFILILTQPLCIHSPPSPAISHVCVYIYKCMYNIQPAYGLICF